MKKRNNLMLAFLFPTIISFSQVSINSTGTPPDASSMLDVSSDSKGVLIPRLTMANRPPASKTGMLIYQTDDVPGFYYANGSNWIKVGDAASDYWVPATGAGIRFAQDVSLGTFTDAESHGLNVQNYTAGKSAIRGADQEAGDLYAEGMLGVLCGNGNPLGLPLFVYNAGVLGIKSNSGGNGAAIYGWNSQNNVNGNYGGLFFSTGAGSYTNYGIYSRANGGATNYAGFYKGRMKIEGHNYSTGAADSLQNLLDVQVTHHTTTDTRAINAISVPVPGYGIAIYGSGGYRGVFGNGAGTNYSGDVVGVYGSASGTAGTRYGVYGYASNTGGNSAIGVYGSAVGSAANWAGYFSGSTYISGDLRIATTTQATGYALSVNGKIACEEVLVKLDSNWPDYVFHDDYKLMGIPELEKSIAENGHLPGLPSAIQVEENGFELADLQMRILEKVEELTLYTIQQQKLIDQLRQEVEVLKRDNGRLGE